MKMQRRLIRRCALAVARRLRCPGGFPRFSVNRRVIALLAMASGGACGLVADAGTVTNLGTLANDETRARAISGDGSVVVGGSYDGNFNQAFRWSSGAMSPLGSLAGDAYAIAYGVNAAGGVVVGYSGRVNPSSQERAVLWTVTSGTMQDLGTLPGGASSQAYAVDASGNTVVGYSASNEGGRAFVWTSLSGSMQNLGVLGTDESSEAYGTSANGSVVVGVSRTFGFDPETGPSVVGNAFRWTSSGMQSLGRLPGGDYAEALAVSAAGDVAVGSSNTAPNGNVVAVRWTVTGSTALESLGVLAGGSRSIAYGVSGDGSSVVGTSMISGGFDRAFLWTPALGMVDLNTYLPTIGFDLNGWTLEQATAISADGTSITGFGTLQNVGTRSFLVQVVPEPSTYAMALAGLACGGYSMFRRRRAR